MTPLEQTRLKLYCMELTSLLLKHNIQPPRVASDEECEAALAVYPSKEPSLGEDWKSAFDVITWRANKLSCRPGATVREFYNAGGFQELHRFRFRGE